MAWACGQCGSGFTLRLSACPRCGSTEPMGRTAIVPKVTAHGGPSDQNAEPGEPGYIQPDDDGEGEDVSPGTSSSTSSETPDSNTTSGRAGARKPARTTGNRSSQDRAGSGTARGTASSTPGTGSGRDSRQ